MQKRILLACLLPASVILASCKPNIAVDTPWLLTEIEPIASPILTTTTPAYRFFSDFTGTIAYAGGCTSSTTSAVSGINEITFNAITVVGTYSGCTITVTTPQGKASAPLKVSSFIVNSAAQNLTEITPVATLTADNTPDYIFKSTVAGAVTSTGSCTFGATSAIANSNKTLTFNTLADGTYSNCVIKVGTGSLAVTPFTVDTTKPVLVQITPVPAVTTVKTPGYTFSSTEAGTITYAGGCTSATTTAVAGNTTVVFNSLAAGAYSACTITVKDAVNNTSTALAVNSFSVIAATPLNDTGVTLCGDYAYGGTLTHNNDVVCSSIVNGKEIANGLNDVPAGQDAYYGPDAGSTTDVDGKAGFTYLKLGATGQPLEIQTGTYTAADAGTEAAGTKWSCVKDTTTNLVWEIKTDAATANFRDKDHKYTWYSTVNNGGSAGTATTALTLCSGTTPTPTGCDTAKYVTDVNTATLCGASDWRVPTAAELSSLRVLSNTAPAIDTVFFPNTMTTAVNYWTSSTDAVSNTKAWTVSASTGIQSVVLKSDTATHLRLVRGGF